MKEKEPLQIDLKGMVTLIALLGQISKNQMDLNQTITECCDKLHNIEIEITNIRKVIGR